jgi:hypothetical protein
MASPKFNRCPLLIAIMLIVAIFQTNVTQGQNIPTWTDVHNLVITGSTLTKTNSNSNWIAGAISEEYTYGDGWIEFSFMAQKYCVMGLANYNTSVAPDFAYSMYAHINGYIYIRENGVILPGIGKGLAKSVIYSSTDILRVERIGSTVYYKKNGATFYISTVPSAGAIYVDCSFSLYQSKINVNNFQLGLVWTGAVDSDWNKPGNWSGNRVPNAQDHVTIKACTTCPAISNDVSVGALNMVSANLNLGDHTLTASNSVSMDGSQIASSNGKMVVLDYTEVKNSTITGSLVLTKTGGKANSWYGGNYFSPEVQFINRSGNTWKLSTQSNNEVRKASE